MALALLCLLAIAGHVALTSATVTACCLPAAFNMSIVGEIDGEREGVRHNYNITGSLAADFPKQQFGLKYKVMHSDIEKIWFLDLEKGISGGFLTYTLQFKNEPNVCQKFAIDKPIGSDYRCFLKSEKVLSEFFSKSYHMTIGKFAEMSGEFVKVKSDMCAPERYQTFSMFASKGNWIRVNLFITAIKYPYTVVHSPPCSKTKHRGYGAQKKIPTLAELSKMERSDVAALFNVIVQADYDEGDDDIQPEVATGSRGDDVTSGGDGGGSGSGGGRTGVDDEDDDDVNDSSQSEEAEVTGGKGTDGKKNGYVWNGSEWRLLEEDEETPVIPSVNGDNLSVVIVDGDTTGNQVTSSRGGDAEGGDDSQGTSSGDDDDSQGTSSGDDDDNDDDSQVTSSGDDDDKDDGSQVTSSGGGDDDVKGDGSQVTSSGGGGGDGQGGDDNGDGSQVTSSGGGDDDDKGDGSQVTSSGGGDDDDKGDGSQVTASGGGDDDDKGDGSQVTSSGGGDDDDKGDGSQVTSSGGGDGQGGDDSDDGSQVTPSGGSDSSEEDTATGKGEIGVDKLSGDVDGDGDYDDYDEDYWEYFWKDEDAAIEEWEGEQDRLNDD